MNGVWGVGGAAFCHQRLAIYEELEMGFTANDVPDQQGKCFIVTGANTGIGFEAALILAKRRARVLLACRDEAKAQAAITRIRAETPGQRGGARGPSGVAKRTTQSLDATLARRLWDVSVQMTGIDPGLPPA